MNFRYTIFDASTGQIDRVFSKSKPGLHPDDVELHESYLDGEFDGSVYHIQGGEAVLRPLVPSMIGASYDLSLLPNGASLEVTDPVGVETVVPAQEDTLELVDPGEWKVRVIDLPFPWVGFETTVVVPEAVEEPPVEEV